MHGANKMCVVVPNDPLILATKMKTNENILMDFILLFSIV